MRPIKLVDGSYEVNQVWFEDVRVPTDNLVGEENTGWSYAKFRLGNERNGVSRVSTSKVLVSQEKERAAEIGIGDGRLADDPLFAARLARMENELLDLELTQLRRLAGSSNGKPNPVSSLLKLRGSELQQTATEILMDGQLSGAAQHIGQEAIQMHGGIGITAEYPVGHYVSRLTAIGHTLGGEDDHLRYLAADLSSHDMITVTG